MKNIIVTGSDGLIGQNLIDYLYKSQNEINILKVNIKSTEAKIKKYARIADFIFHLEDLSTSTERDSFEKINVEFTKTLINILIETGSKAPIVYMSSHKALQRNDYGYSKFTAEQILLNYYKDWSASVCIYRLPEVFGEGFKPNENSLIATYCYNIHNNIPINKEKPDEILKFVHISDVIDEFIRALFGYPNMLADSCFAVVPQPYTITKKELIQKINNFAQSRITNFIPSLAGKFDQNLYATFLSYIDIENLSHEIKFEENESSRKFDFLNSNEQGNFRIYRIKINKSLKKHWHEKKSQKVMVIEGNAIINIERDKNHSKQYIVNGSCPIMIDIPPHCSHDIINVGNVEAICIIWTNQLFNETAPDTYYSKTT